jgi:hypothetical protein
VKSFQVEWSAEQFFRVTVQAVTEDDAELKFFAGEFDKTKIEAVGSEVIEVVEITEID